MSTLNQKIKVLNNFADAHLQINSFGAGQIQDFATSGVTEYPAMWIDFEPSKLIANDYGTGTYFTVFRVYLLDRLLKGKRNLNDAFSDMESIALDIIAYLQNPTNLIRVDTTNLVFNQVFEASHDDEVAGYWFDLTFREVFKEDRCQIPI